MIVDPVDYFEKKAGGYDARSERGSWQSLREKEQRAVFELLSPHEAELILDAGCGAGYYAKRIQEKGATVIGIDASEAMVEAARTNGIDARHGTLESFELEERFDKILCAGVIEFCSQPLEVIRNLAAHLKDKGELVILVPRKSLGGFFYKVFHRLHGVSIRSFSVNELHTLLSQAGLSLSETDALTPAFSIVCKASH